MGRREYTRWWQMKARCLNPAHRQYADYGKRGIQVCERWLTFANFYADMGPCPPGLTLERTDNDGHYEPSNCVWATRHAQTLNRRNTRWITYRGKTLCVTDWGRRFGLKSGVLASRLKRYSVDATFGPYAHLLLDNTDPWCISPWVLI